MAAVVVAGSLGFAPSVLAIANGNEAHTPDVPPRTLDEDAIRKRQQMQQDAQREMRDRANERAEAAKEHVRSVRLRLDDAKEERKAMLEQRRAEILDRARQAKGRTSTAEERKQQCVARKQNLDERLSRVAQTVQDYLVRVDAMLEKVQDYKSESGVVIDNWDFLLNEVTNAQTDAAAAVTLLQNMQLSVNCDSESVVSDVAGFQAGMQQSLEALRVYRVAVMDLVMSVVAAQQVEVPVNE
ncbi:hypothetical protein CR970_02695 [Candidatus Saccharibacteria bacterium]|nr:MAG: hypothetical protein CR970_02695 [Candidatus Saccharibacteria bacterium]